MTDLRRSVSPCHLDLLLQYLEQHPDLALSGPRSRHDQLHARRLWERVARVLNKVDRNVVKSGKGWCRYWADLKCKTRRKYKTNPQTFTACERRVLNLLTDEDGTLLPNAHQQTDKEYQQITNKSKKKIKRSTSQDINEESNSQRIEHTDKIYIINHIEHGNDYNTKINGENSDNVRSGREMYSSEEQNNLLEDQSNSTADLNNRIELHDNTTVKHKYSTSEHNNKSTDEHMYNTAEHYNTIEEHKYITSEHHNSIEEHNNSNTEYNTYNAAKTRTDKTIEELKKEILEFQLKRQKELFEIEKRERDERHKLQMDILRLKRDILVKELNN